MNDFFARTISKQVSQPLTYIMLYKDILIITKQGYIRCTKTLSMIICSTPKNGDTTSKSGKSPQPMHIILKIIVTYMENLEKAEMNKIAHIA